MREIERIVCPVLESQLCSAYVDRPVICRSTLSDSLDACLRIFNENAAEDFHHAGNSLQVRTYIVLLLQSSLMLAGLPHFHFELIQGVAAALKYDDAEERWLVGEHIFADVPVDVADVQRGTYSGLVRQLVDAVAPTL